MTSRIYLNSVKAGLLMLIFGSALIALDYAFPEKPIFGVIPCALFWMWYLYPSFPGKGYFSGLILPSNLLFSCTMLFFILRFYKANEIFSNSSLVLVVVAFSFLYLRIVKTPIQRPKGHGVL